MEISAAEWNEILREMDALRAIVEAWPPDPPNPNALRCEHSRHRTLAHLRGAQETWLQAVLVFAERDGASINLPHPWRLFTNRSDELIPWEEHRAAYLADRDKWEELLRRPGFDRNRGGKLSRKPHTIASLTKHLVLHERHHIRLL